MDTETNDTFLPGKLTTNSC